MNEDEVIANQHVIIANQERIQQNQEKLDLILANHEKILAYQSRFNRMLAGQGNLTGTPEMIGENPAFKQVLKKAHSVATSDVTVLVCGETGTGKELLARDIHARSARSRQPIVTLNCATLPPGLIESDLFGHEKGAFTGAFQKKPGRFEMADGGTIFLDEVGELPLETQSKFLRFLQHGEFVRVGGTQTLKINVRVIAATNQPLEKLVYENKFRADLFYRLNVFPITLPPLRERREDIEPLIDHFICKYNRRFGKSVTSIEEDSLRRMRDYNWPGNIRELEHVIESAVLLSEGEVMFVDRPIEIKEFSIGNGAERKESARREEPATNSYVTLDEHERAYIIRVLEFTRGRISGKKGAAAILGLPASTLRSRMKKLGIE